METIGKFTIPIIIIPKGMVIEDYTLCICIRCNYSYLSDFVKAEIRDIFSSLRLPSNTFIHINSIEKVLTKDIGKAPETVPFACVTGVRETFCASKKRFAVAKIRNISKIPPLRGCFSENSKISPT